MVVRVRTLVITAVIALVVGSGGTLWVMSTLRAQEQSENARALAEVKTKLEANQQELTDALTALSGRTTELKTAMSELRRIARDVAVRDAEIQRLSTEVKNEKARALSAMADRDVLDSTGRTTLDARGVTRAILDRVRAVSDSR